MSSVELAPFFDEKCFGGVGHMRFGAHMFLLEKPLVLLRVNWGEVKRRVTGEAFVDR